MRTASIITHSVNILLVLLFTAMHLSQLSLKKWIVLSVIPINFADLEMLPVAPENVFFRRALSTFWLYKYN